ncbi:MAG: hypothetical protein OHK0036_11390 [Bacteroidia bacterium]
MEVSHGYYTNQSNVINPYNCLLYQIINTGGGAGLIANNMSNNDPGDYDGKLVLINLNLTGVFQTGTNPIIISICKKNIAQYYTSNNKATLYCKDFQYYVTFDKNDVISVQNVDGRLDVWGTMVVTLLNVQ